jgi:hypothetical protein
MNITQREKGYVIIIQNSFISRGFVRLRIRIMQVASKDKRPLKARLLEYRKQKKQTPATKQDEQQNHGKATPTPSTSTPFTPPKPSTNEPQATTTQPEWTPRTTATTSSWQVK